jgi:hypothetical protein
MYGIHVGGGDESSALASLFYSRTSRVRSQVTFWFGQQN